MGYIYLLLYTYAITPGVSPYMGQSCVVLAVICLNKNVTQLIQGFYDSLQIQKPELLKV